MSTSNKTLDQLCRDAGIALDDAYRGRLIDIGAPEGGAGFFEALHGYPDVAALSVRLRELAAECFGWPSRRFIRRLVEWRAKDAGGLRAWFEIRRDFYLKRAKEITAAGRQLDRIHQKFATLYAAGCLAIKFGILLWKKKDLREALLKCERDHVSLVAAHGDTSTAQTLEPFDRLLSYIRNTQHKFLNLGKLASGGEDVAGQDGKCGYRLDYKGRLEFLFTEACFLRIAGSKSDASALKQDLDRRSLIGKTEAGKQGAKFMVRRGLDSTKRRTWVVAIDATILDAK